MGRQARTAIASIKGAGFVTLVDLGVAGISSIAIAAAFVPTLGLVMLLESAALMLLGGAMSFVGRPGVRRMTALVTKTKIEVSRAEVEDLDAMAATYALAGTLLFLESLALALATV